MSTSILEQIIEPFTDCLTEEAARKIVNLRADHVLQSRVDELATKANFGTMNDDERAEYVRFLAAFNLVSILQAKARRMLSP